MPPLADINYEVHSLRDLHPDMADQLEKKCRENYFNSMLGLIARPETLERGDGLATTFNQVERGTIDCWHLLAPMMKDDVEESRQMRRYLGIHSAPQSGRRPRGKIEVVPVLDGSKVNPVERTMTGFQLMEYDLLNGALLFPVSLAWVLSGPAFEATTILSEEAVRRAKADREAINFEREQLGLPPYPPIRYTWLVSPFQEQSRWTKSIIQRGFRRLEEIEKEENEMDLAAFPPEREIFIPQPFLKGFQIFVRKLENDDDDGGVPEQKKKRKRTDY
ncbi:hypothetical protein T439DRAFT_323435 [Meredithblackwellia eburnea MCA 4105]